MKNFTLGEAVLYCEMWGDTYIPDKLYRWGELRAGFISNIELLEGRDSALYSVGTVDERDSTKMRFKLLGEHLIFKADEKELAKEALCKYCLEVS